jgi:hypothetical protein
MVSRIKDDLVSEIIRVSQTNLLARKKTESTDESGDDTVMKRIQTNAASYRNKYQDCLDSYSAVELGDMLSKLTQSKTDLDEILKNYPQR